MRKFTTTIRITESVRESLQKQADVLGLGMSAYIAYLVMKEEREKREKEKERKERGLTYEY